MGWLTLLVQEFVGRCAIRYLKTWLGARHRQIAEVRLNNRSDYPTGAPLPFLGYTGARNPEQGPKEFWGE